jgi:hypothetical protein
VEAPRMLKLALVIGAVWLSCSTAAAQFVIGRYAGEFLSLGAGARALAMGGASSAMPTPATAGYYNPSALASIRKNYLEFMHASQFDNLFTYDYLSYARPLPGGYAGALTVLYTRVGGIPMTTLTDPNQPLSDNNRVILRKLTGDDELAVMAAAGRDIGKGWRGGANAKILYKSVADQSAYGLGFDAGVGKTVARNLDVGLVAHDLTTSILAWGTGRTEAILPSVVAGGSWAQDITALNARLTLAADLDGHFESRGSAERVSAGPLSVQPRFGLEYLISNTVGLRGGYDGDSFTAGAGLRFAWLNVNAAFQRHDDLGLTHRVSVGITW